MIRSKLRPRRPLHSRKIALQVDRLEAREVLSGSAASVQIAHTMFGLTPSSGGGPGGGYTPAQVTAAYGFTGVSFNGVAGNGAGETIAIVDAYNDPNIASDLSTFDSEFSLPTANLKVVNETGGTTLPASDSTGGWELEESLDVEWAHAIAPNANIVLVEASSSNESDLLSGVNTASTIIKANVVSMSWGGGEFSGETSYDSDFQHAGVAYVASSGDSGAPISWPAASPNVLAVGGTTLTINGTTYGGETGWSGSGGGPSAYYTQPAYQAGIVTQTTMRANPDVAYGADPNTGFSVYDSVPYSGTTYGWLAVGGTSAGSPQWAGLVAIADQGRAAYGLPAIDATSSQELQTTLYKNTSDFHDITSGTSTGTPNYSAGTGYDYVTGLGSPIANLVVQSLDGTGAAQTPDHLVVSGGTTVVAGSSYSFTVTAETSSGAVDPNYVGDVTLTSTDSQAVLGSQLFTSANRGTYTFTVTLKTAGTQSITATDSTTGAASATESGIVVSPAAASKFLLTGLTSSSSVGASDSFTITAKDPYGNVATGYTGTVTFSSTDKSAGLPGAYTFTTANQGVASFSVTFNTAGTQTVTATGGGITVTSSGVVVSPTGTITLSATASSSSQINLSWNGLNGAAGYSIQESANGSSGWTQIGTTATGITTFSNTGLTAGTTYYYRVEATGGNGSAFSNVAGATTPGGGTTSGSVSLWPNSYTPSENYYSYGNYELGVKIKTSVAGQVTGFRMYEQSWMSGSTHVGHLWSPTGALLATATFTSQAGSGWEQVNLSSPVTIAANTVYIVSYSSGGGYFGYNSTYFDGSGVTNGPLQALANGVSGGDGVYGRGGSFPTTSGNGMNFFADVVFAPSSTPAAVIGNGGSGKVSAGGGSSGSLEFALAVEAPTAGPVISLGSSATTTPPKILVNTQGSWPGRRVASQSATFGTKNGRPGSDFGV